MTQLHQEDTQYKYPINYFRIEKLLLNDANKYCFGCCLRGQKLFLFLHLIRCQASFLPFFAIMTSHCTIDEDK